MHTCKVGSLWKCVYLYYAIGITYSLTMRVLEYCPNNEGQGIQYKYGVLIEIRLIIKPYS